MNAVGADKHGASDDVPILKRGDDISAVVDNALKAHLCSHHAALGFKHTQESLMELDESSNSEMGDPARSKKKGAHTMCRTS